MDRLKIPASERDTNDVSLIDTYHVHPPSPLSNGSTIFC